MWKMAIVVVVSGLWMGTALAHQQGKKLHVSEAPADQRVEAITYCKGTYRVTTRAGFPIEYPEFDFRLKTDGSSDGPAPRTPVVINAGMQGDRGLVVFSSPGGISPYIKATCLERRALVPAEGSR